MPRPQSEKRTKTTIGEVPKTLVLRIRKYAQSDKSRKGYESTATVLERIVSDYENSHPTTSEPTPTY
ncbi:MAG: hypothetical protein GWN01_01385 [Nitrosopumilaceae archaeon]|nr:hypothetical protein [Nitrosopumilaceae archaeon]NIU86012.1 hypothetical protein [Nitrosopumilaceae archaeon]NIX60231.1 hypothetical protein [Nitrosopumilaceae archaeon]